jgi:vacuolar-type H+-ATPase subunit I/STV1
MNEPFINPKYPLWTQEQAIAYECAREVITDLSAICTVRIYDEMTKQTPDHALVASLEEKITRLFKERRELTVGNQDAIAKIRHEYGSEVRAWRAQVQTQAV